ncbi:Ig-like domain-containing protein [Poseidonibacter lekithochrous]|uniref:Ig-like domain-containing protein n=1 Tax=Poseidonibacter lekithochrous TaxID=1904463 RepID=UPI000D378AB4|nr:Ig-like domain-containing protein [Poseidonibacter lekithochrous]
MNRYQFIKSSCIAITTAVLLTGCGGGGGGSSSSSSSGSSTVSAKGYLIDAAVSGVKYINADGSTGFTNDDGSFDYKTGTTRFYVGGIKIGEINQLSSDKKTFIQDIVGVSRSNISHPKVLKIATFLQSIDSDPSTNEIEIGNNFQKFNSVNDDISNDSSNVNTILSNKGFSVKSQFEVKKHLEDELKNNNIQVDITAPIVSSTNTTKRLNVSSNINIIFSENLLVETITSNNFELKKLNSDIVVSSSISYNSSTNTVSINPNANLDYNEQYILTIKTDVKDNSNNALRSELTYNFTTLSLPDDTKPSVTFTTESTNAVLNKALEIKFSEAIDNNLINSTNIILKDNGNNNIETTLAYNSVTNSVTITPKTSLKPDTEYTIKVKDTITDLAGNALETASNNEVSFNFTTINQVESTAPAISSSSLDSNANDIAINSNITLTFSKEVDIKTLENNIKLKKNGTNFDVSRTLTLVGNTVTINPVSDMSKNATYTLTVLNEITDIYANSLSDEKTYTFTTEQEVDNTRPVLVDSESTLNDNDKNVAINSNFSFTFNENLAENTLQNDGIVLEDINGNKTAITVTYTNKIININSNTDLKYATSYKLKLTSKITDISGNEFDGMSGLSGLHDKVINFTTIANPSDTIAPTLVSPTNLGTVAKDAKIIVEFNEELKNITNSDLDIPSGYLFEKYENKKIYLKPTYNDYNTTYTLVLKASISDLANNTLGSNLSVTFKTVQEADTKAPEVLSSIPQDNIENVSIKKDLAITFNEALDSSSVNATNIQLVKKDNQSTNLISDSEVTYLNNVITVNPTSDLDLNTNYILLIKKDGVKDLATNKFEGSYGSDYKIDFKTRLIASTVTCDSGYLEHNNACYKINDDKKNFADAKIACEATSSKLINPKTLFYSGGWNSSLVGEFASNISLNIDKVYWTNDDSTNQSYVIKKATFSFSNPWGSPSSTENTDNLHEYICVKK